MKKIILLFIPLLLISSLTSEPLKNITPVDLANNAFNILQKMDDLSVEDYIQSFLSIEDAREYSLNEEIVTEKLKLRIARKSKENWDRVLERHYNQIKETSKKYEIVFKDITYLNFESSIKPREGNKNCEGFMTFKYKEEVYKIKVSSFFNGEEFIITRIKSLQKSI